MGNKVEAPKEMKVIKGVYTDKVQEIFDMNWNKKENLSNEQKINRECQLTIDFLFKYLRSGSKKHLELVQERLKIK